MKSIQITERSKLFIPFSWLKLRIILQNITIYKYEKEKKAEGTKSFYNTCTRPQDNNKESKFNFTENKQIIATHLSYIL